MSLHRFFIFGLFLLVLSCKKSTDISAQTLVIEGLQDDVEIVRDEWGINHIYANNQHDLFFAQGYAAAKDRLFQFEIWRRQATGTVAELLGERELKRDIGTRLFKFRGDMTSEMNYYHDEGVEIITAYTDGVNAYINEVLENPDSLPIEFKILNTLPQKWTPEVVISRHQGLLGNIGQELQIGRAVAAIGEEKVKELLWFHPKEPKLSLDPAIDKSLLFDDILELYNAYRKPVAFQPEDVVEKYRNTSTTTALLQKSQIKTDSLALGSNNWVVSGKLMEDGNTYMANDPHRTIAVPSLRYMAHLVAPGWNVIGGGEPEIPGISIGHNEYGAWGLTVFRTDGEDLYVYDLNPENPDEYKYQGEWIPMTTFTEIIPVKGQEAKSIELKYTLHGPVTYVDEEHLKAYAVRCAWLEPGGSPYLASLRMDQAKTWEEFREACNYSHIPGENMIWADAAGNIGWQAVGIAPIRRNFSGLVPVPGDGRYEWDGFLPIIEKPNAYNPDNGFLATANQNVTPENYEHWDAIGFSWSDPYRGERVEEVLESGKKMTMEDMKALQVDYTSLPARQLVPLLNDLVFSDKAANAKTMLMDWDYQLLPNSIEAAIYVEWETQLKEKAEGLFIPEEAKKYITALQLKTVMDWIINPNKKFGPNSESVRNQFISDAFKDALVSLEKRLGSDMAQWHYGQEKNKHTYMSHALGSVVKDSLKDKMNLGPLPRGGNGYTPGSTGNNDRQSSGASFRLIVNTGDWDTAVGTNGPGQSGDPDSPFYDNLFKSWAEDQYFPVFFSKEKIDSVAADISILKPKK
ncbi:penicillin acylase family protein [Croceivirga thetidis]|uniref:Penicillin acylase family protein n=1 Tax=Croceivirga thetidis TaxID=2721623 RepID=A0ABX1GRZ6_9FLAO|nr:penicillin acylase family protein [Croceivirga thetidis]NKI31806.1 penicillin acylase family protein [Croceivirga thetidis]